MVTENAVCNYDEGTIVDNIFGDYESNAEVRVLMNIPSTPSTSKTYTNKSKGADAQVQVNLGNGAVYNSRDITDDSDLGTWEITLSADLSKGHVKATSIEADDGSKILVEGDWTCRSD